MLDSVEAKTCLKPFLLQKMFKYFLVNNLCNSQSWWVWWSVFAKIVHGCGPIAVIFCKVLQSVTVKRKLTGRKISEKFTDRFGNICMECFQPSHWFPVSSNRIPCRTVFVLNMLLNGRGFQKTESWIRKLIKKWLLF